MSTSKRLAKNTVLMYIRMFLILLINFYTSRVLLQKLGVEDFGTYNLVASIIIMFSSLRLMFASSTQRFLNYEIGRGHEDRVQTVFNMSVYINVCITVIFLIVVEIVGLWFFYSKINIDPSRLSAAFIVFQCSVVGSVINIFTTSYDAVIIAHERMNFLALSSIIEALLKLVAVFLLAIGSIDKLSFYGILLLIISVIIFLINYLYCKANFKIYRLKWIWDKHLFKDMLSFAGWNFFGKSAASVTQSGLNMLLNFFGGPVVNAARGIAFQLNSATNQFVNNVNIVLDPFFIKTYASNDLEKFYLTFNFTSKALYFVQLLLVIPFYFLSSEILHIWLGNVPDYSAEFLKLVLIWSLIRAPHSPIDKLFKSVGDIKWYQIIEGVILAAPLLFSYVLLKIGCDYTMTFVSMIIFEIINLIMIIILAKKQCNLPVSDYLRKVVVPIILCTIPFIVGLLLVEYIPMKTVPLILATVLVEICSLIAFVSLLTQEEKKQLKSILGKR